LSSGCVGGDEKSTAQNDQSPVDAALSSADHARQQDLVITNNNTIISTNTNKI
jgi:hypothetical protein